MTFSISSSAVPETLVVGLRYLKRDGTFTEDTFLFRRGQPEIERCYKASIEKILPEYKGTHHQQP